MKNALAWTRRRSKDSFELLSFVMSSVFVIVLVAGFSDPE
jgi:hypothetical protein